MYFQKSQLCTFPRHVLGTFRGTSRCLGDGCGSPAGAPERRYAYGGGGAGTKPWENHGKTIGKMLVLYETYRDLTGIVNGC